MTQTDTQIPLLLHVTILAPEKTLFSGYVDALTCHNPEGEFDILPLHSNFVSMIDEYVILHLPNKKEQKIPIGRALLKATQNTITILLNIDLSERDVLFKALFQQVEGQKQSSALQDK